MKEICVYEYGIRLKDVAYGKGILADAVRMFECFWHGKGVWKNNSWSRLKKPYSYTYSYTRILPSTVTRDGPPS